MIPAEVNVFEFKPTTLRERVLNTAPSENSLREWLREFQEGWTDATYPDLGFFY